MASATGWLTTSEAAEIVGVSRETVRIWLLRKDAPKHTRTLGGHLRIARQPFLDWWEQYQKERSA